MESDRAAICIVSNIGRVCMFAVDSEEPATVLADRIANECSFAPSEWDEIITESDGYCDLFVEDLKQTLQKMKDGFR